MSMVWILLSLAVLGAIAALAWSQRGRRTDMGSVSNQWVAEHRLSQTPDLRR